MVQSVLKALHQKMMEKDSLLLMYMHHSEEVREKRGKHMSK